ncbi:MAG: malonyl CoA-ACP transacylase [Micromonosporaceae bacterium]|nr:malonyl CoA-ACP transacylase [Micromonosporaceae bacterium]
MTGAVAHVAGEAVPESLVEARLAALHASPRAGLLPRGGKEARQLRRWVGQLAVTAALCEAAARREGLEPTPEPIDLDDVAALELGSLAAAALTESPYARAAYRDLRRRSEPREPETRAYYDRNPDLFRGPEPGSVRPYQQVRGEIAARLRGAAARKRFLGWLDGWRAELVALCPGWEHPGDPRQPDNTHRH